MSQRLSRLVVASGAALLLAGVIVVAEAVPAAAADITTACTGTTSGSTFTLTADCGPVTSPLTVPDGVTVDGAGHTISATDAGGPQWNGGIVTNAGASMNIENVTISGPTNGFQLCTEATNVLYGIYFLDASGTVNNVTINHIFQFQNAAFGSCQTGRAIRAEATTSVARTVTITNTTATDYQKTAFEARGAAMTMDVSNSTAGPPHDLRGLMAQNGVTYVGATGTVANNTIFGSGDQQAGVGGATDGTAVLLFGAHDVTVDHNTMTSLPADAGTDIGVGVVASSTSITISFNTIGRDGPDNPDPTGIGVFVERGGPLRVRVGEGSRETADGSSEATLICNTFSNWTHNIVGAVQIDCTPLPNGTECATYSAHAPNIEGGTLNSSGAFVPPVEPLTWEITTGSLPPGLTMATDGTITGTPTQGANGQFTFTLHVSDSSAPPLTATSDQSITIAADDCTPPTTPTTVPPTEPLARTGRSSAPLLIVGLIALATGLGLVLIANRRRSRYSARPTNSA